MNTSANGREMLRYSSEVSWQRVEDESRQEEMTSATPAIVMSEGGYCGPGRFHRRKQLMDASRFTRAVKG